MSLPKHVNPAENRTASAPYNFVPLPEVVVKAVNNANDLPDHSTYSDERYPHSGFFDVTLTTKSPLYVRCPLTIEDFMRQERGEDANLPFRQQVKNSPHFYYLRRRDQPIIPGSSLRGMLRSVLEIASYGKVSHVTDKNLIYRAVGDRTALGSWYREQTLGPNHNTPPQMHFDYPSPQMKGGYLCKHNGQWAIRPAVEHHNESLIHVEYSAADPIIGGHGGWKDHNVFVQPVPRTASNRGRRGPGNLTLNLAVTSAVASRTSGLTAPSGMVPAVLVESGHMSGAHAKHMHCAVYEEDPSATPISIPREDWEAYEEDRDMTRGIKTRRLTALGQALFYLLDNVGNLMFFGSTMMFRLPYQRSIHQLIPESLWSPTEVDYADALFGFVRESVGSGLQVLPQGSKTRSYASRISVRDAVLASEIAPSELWLTGEPQQAISPRILASPKPTSFQLYLTQPEKEADRADISHYDSPTKDANGVMRGHETVIRGHKVYWHQGAREVNDLKESDPQWLQNGRVKDRSTQHTQFKPVRSGVEFKFTVHFENLSDRELGAMCWTLNPVGDQAKTYCHHLGMGKPLGMGAVKLDSTLHLTNRATRYSTLFNGDGWQTGAEGDGESLADREVLENRTREFEQHILSEVRPNRPCAHLSDLKRIGMLLKTMEWPGFRPNEAGPLFLDHPDDHPNIRYMSIKHQTYGNEYRDRPVLPDPSAFGRLTGYAEPQTNFTSEASSTHIEESTEDQAKRIGADLITRVHALRVVEVAGRIPGLVKEWQAISDESIKKSVALEILGTINKAGRDKASKDKDWYKELLKYKM